jgi:hypothetical protein
MIETSTALQYYTKKIIIVFLSRRHDLFEYIPITEGTEFQ